MHILYHKLEKRMECVKRRKIMKENKSFFLELNNDVLMEDILSYLFQFRLFF